MNLKYTRVLNYTAVKWLSAGKATERLLHMVPAIKALFKSLEATKKQKKDKETTSIKTLNGYITDPKFIMRLAFLVDYFAMMNKLNITFQGKGKIWKDVSIHLFVSH